MQLVRAGWMFSVAALALTLAGCEEVEVIVDARRDLTPHESYLESLRSAGLAATALGRDWSVAAERAVSTPHAVALPFREEGYLPPEQPTAVGYRLRLERGRVLGVRLELEGGYSLRLFVDLFRVPESPTDPLRPVLTTDSLSNSITYEPFRAGEFILRLQPELLRGGRYRLVLSEDPALAFPVEGGAVRDIGSVFGADREGGRRLHHGVDIFARRGTPAVAAVSGEVYRVQNTAVGGKVVWIRDSVRNARLYYAHLDAQLVEEGSLVEPGDTVGLVGNTGNARTTPSHLHFGVYSRGRGDRGPVDPFPFIRPARRGTPTLAGDPELVGAWVRVTETALVLRSPREDSDVAAELTDDAPLRVLASAGSWYRVALPDGTEGWVPVSSTEAASMPLRAWVATSPSVVRAGPHASAPVVADVGPGTSLPVIGSYAGFAYVLMPQGLRGWVSEEG